MLPFSLVECDSFKNLIHVLTKNENKAHASTSKANELSAPTRRFLVPYMQREYSLFKNALIEKFDAASNICVTTDFWSCHRRGFLGMTIHMIKHDDLSRESYALACKRVKGAHTAEVIKKEFMGILNSFNIDPLKVIKIVTDGAANFNKAFKLLKAEFQNASEASIDNPEELFGDNSEFFENLFNSNESDEEIIEGNQANVAAYAVNMSQILNSTVSVDMENDETDDYEQNIDMAFDEVVAMENDKCSAHRLNLNLTSDLKVLKKNVLEELDATHVSAYRAASKKINTTINKCLALFKKQTGSSKASDRIKEVLDVLLVTPSATRWNSLFDSIRHLLALIESKFPEVNKLCEEFNLKRFYQTDSRILQEYMKVY